MARYAKHVVDLANGGIFGRVVGRNFHFTKATREALHTAHRKADDVLKRSPVKRARQRYVGSTPKKTSKTGQDVINNMHADKRIRGWDPNNPRDLVDVEVKAENGSWGPIEDFDMGHKPVDAVSYWNNIGRYSEPRSKQVREWMTSPENYELVPRDINRSGGGSLSSSGVRYQAPVKLPDGIRIEDLTPEILRSLGPTIKPLP